MKSNKCMNEEIKLIVVLARKADTLLKPAGGYEDA